MNNKVSKFYDEFNSRLVRDFVFGNPRVEAQCRFFKRLLKEETKRILIVGCGIGDVAFHLARAVSAKGGRVLALDISDKNIAVANQLFQAVNLSFACCDILEHPPEEERWDLILFPDVYEHIPLNQRPHLHRILAELLAPQGEIALTCPSLQHQRSLRKAGHGLQVIDEDVSVQDLLALSQVVEGYLVHFCYQSVFCRNDYFHALVSRIPDSGDLQDYPPSPSPLRGLILRIWARVRALHRTAFLRRKGVFRNL